MVHGPSSEVIAVLNSGTVQEKISALKDVKNLIVGHDQRKESAVKLGIVEPLAKILSPSKTATKLVGRVDGSTTRPATKWSEEDDLMLQAVLAVGSLAAGGQAFLAPLCAADIPRILSDSLSAELPTRLSIATLQTLHTFATFWPIGDSDDSEYDFWSVVFNNPKNVDLFCDWLWRPASGSTQQVRLVAGLISTLPENDHSSNSIKARLAQSRILTTLTSLLVSHAIDRKIFQHHGHVNHVPPAPPTSAIPGILAAISTLITGSNYRTHCFILSPPVTELLSATKTELATSSVLFGPRSGVHSVPENLLPPLHVPTSRTTSYVPVSNHFPAAKTMQSMRQNGGSAPSTPLHVDIDHANAVCAWLLVLARSMQGQHRLSALWLLALVSGAVDTNPVCVHRTEYHQRTLERERQLALLAVPLAVRLVQFASESKGSEEEDTEGHRLIKEQACKVLALLVRNSKDLQIAAVNANAIKFVCSILRKSFDNVSLAKPAWSPKPVVPENNTPSTRRLGSSGFPSEIIHAMRCRQGALSAIAAIAEKEDPHRKAIIDAGVVSFITESLKPFSPNALGEASNGRTLIMPKDGNTNSTLLEGCRAAKSMSRSVTVLRTSLFDEGIGKPLIHLLQHPSLEIQIAATDVICNLTPDFSALRESLVEGNVVKTLVAHARSNSPALRLSSLWALKHLMSGCPKDLKLATLEELGTGWLVDIIQGENHGPVPASNNGGVGLSTPNAAGEQVDLLNPSSMDVDEPDPEAMDEEDEDGEVLYDEASSTHYQASQLRSTLNPPPNTFNSKRYLSSIREIEQSDDYISYRDEVAIQVQALDFIRNLMNGDDCRPLSDHIMTQIGSAKVYDILTAKLLPIPRSASTFAPGRPANDRPVYQSTDLVLSAIHIIIHLANASPKHRQMLIAQKSLLQALLPHFEHSDHRVRTLAVWAVINLTYMEDESDRKDARQRSNELRAVGIEQAVRALQSDPDRDVRERVKTAIRHLDKM